MASSDSENKSNHPEAAKPEQKPKSKARSRSKKAKPGAKNAGKKEEAPDVQHTENRQESPLQAAPVKPEETPAASADDPSPVPEKTAKKKGKPGGRKPKAEGQSQPAAAEQAPSAGPTSEQTGGGQKTQTDAGQSAPEQAAESAKAAEGVKRPKAKRRGRPKKSGPAPAPDAPQPVKPEPATPEPATPEPATPKSSAEENRAGQPGHEPEAEKTEGTGKTKDKNAEILPAASEEKKKPKAKRRGKSRKKKSKQVAAEEEGAEQDEALSAPSQEHTAEPASLEEEAAMPETAEPVAPEPQTPEPLVPKREPPLIIIASGNPAKIKAAELAFSRMFPGEKFDYEGISVPSGVSDQPMSDDETFAGAYMRAQACRETRPEATYWVGMEGGLEEIGEELHAFAWMVIIGPDELMGKSRTATFVLPPAVAELILVEGKELGEADDLVFGKTDSKSSSGAVGILTHGLLDRANYYAEALVLALVPFKNPHLYKVEQAEAVEA